MVQNILVLLLVAAAVAYVVVRLHRMAAGRSKCGCGAKTCGPTAGPCPDAAGPGDQLPLLPPACNRGECSPRP